MRPLILIVDDEAVNRTILRKMLDTLGYRTHVAINGQEAVEAARRERYAAILMDCLMPVLDGYDATRAIRQDEASLPADVVERHVPVIAVTAVALQGARERCLAVGMDDYLSKPVIAQSLAAVLKRWIDDRRSTSPWTLDDAPGTPMGDAGLLDRRAIEALRELGADDWEAFLAEVIDDFRRDVSSRIEDARSAVATGDAGALVQSLHTIAGCAAMVGAVQVERLARSWPAHHLTEGGSPQASADIRALEAAFARTCAMLETAVGPELAPGAGAARA